MVRGPLAASLALGALAFAGAFPETAARADPLGGGADVTASVFEWRPLGSRAPGWNDGLALAWGPTLADDEGPARFTALTQIELAAFDSRSYAVAISTHAFEAAARLGLFEPEVRAGVARATLDVFDGTWSAGKLLSPRAEIGIGLRVGRMRASLGVQGEYFWRWFGPSILERGIVLDLRYERPWHPRP